jgi:hypothetical protein
MVSRLLAVFLVHQDELIVVDLFDVVDKVVAIGAESV